MNRKVLLLYGLLLSMLAGYNVHGQMYTLEFTSNSSYAPSILKADTLRYKSRLVLEGSLRVQALQELPGRSYMRLEMMPRLFQVSDEGLMQEPDMVVATRLLSLPVHVQLNDSGRVVQVYFDTAVSSTYRQLWNQLIAYMQFIVPGKTMQRAASWQVREEDRVGFFEARYERLRRNEQEQGIRFRKRGGGYTSFASQGLIDYVQDLHAEYVLDNEWLSTVELNEILEIKVKGDTRAATTSTFKLQKTSGSIGTDSIAGIRRLPGIMPGFVAVTLSNFVTRHEIKTTMYRQLLQQQTLRDVLSAIDTLTVTRDNKVNINRRVAALVYLYPALLDSFVERIAAAPPSSPAFEVIVKGLAHAGTPAAQKKIGLLMHQHRNNAEAIDFFTNTLLFLEEPDTAFIAAVQRIAYDRQQFDAPIQRALRYLLGSFSNTLKKSNRDIGTATVTNTLLAINRESRKSAKEKTLELLGIAGNAAVNATFPVVRGYVDNADEDIHAQALLALRLMDTAAVDTLLLQQFISDTNVLSRTVILTVFRYRPITNRVIDAVTEMLSHVRDESLAISGARLLYEYKKAFPAVVPALQQLAGQTVNAALKKEIYALLTNQTDQSL